jgi:hypothetical protein
LAKMRHHETQQTADHGAASMISNSQMKDERS